MYFSTLIGLFNWCHHSETIFLSCLNPWKLSLILDLLKYLQWFIERTESILLARMNWFPSIIFSYTCIMNLDYKSPGIIIDDAIVCLRAWFCFKVFQWMGRHNFLHKPRIKWNEIKAATIDDYAFLRNTYQMY